MKPEVGGLCRLGLEQLNHRRLFVHLSHLASVLTSTFLMPASAPLCGAGGWVVEWVGGAEQVCFELVQWESQASLTGPEEQQPVCTLPDPRLRLPPANASLPCQPPPPPSPTHLSSSSCAASRLP